VTEQGGGRNTACDGAGRRIAGVMIGIGAIVAA